MQKGGTDSVIGTGILTPQFWSTRSGVLSMMKYYQIQGVERRLGPSALFLCKDPSCLFSSCFCKVLQSNSTSSNIFFCMSYLDKIQLHLHRWLPCSQRICININIHFPDNRTNYKLTLPIPHLCPHSLDLLQHSLSSVFTHLPQSTELQNNLSWAKHKKSFLIWQIDELSHLAHE